MESLQCPNHHAEAHWSHLDFCFQHEGKHDSIPTSSPSLSKWPHYSHSVWIPVQGHHFEVSVYMWCNLSQFLNHSHVITFQTFNVTYLYDMITLYLEILINIFICGTSIDKAKQLNCWISTNKLLKCYKYSVYALQADSPNKVLSKSIILNILSRHCTGSAVAPPESKHMVTVKKKSRITKRREKMKKKEKQEAGIQITFCISRWLLHYICYICM